MQDLYTTFGKSPWHLCVNLLYKIGQLLLKASKVCQLMW